MKYKILASVILLGIGSLVVYKYYDEDVPTQESISEEKATPPTKNPAHAPSKRVYPPDYKIDTPKKTQDFFNKLDLVYAPKPIFSKECKVLANITKNDLVEYQEYKEHYDKLTQKYGALIEKSYVAPGYIKWGSDEVGYGFFAACDLPAGSMVGEYTGEILPNAAFRNKTWSWNYPIRSAFSKHLPTSISLTGHKYRNEINFVNHSDHPNVVSNLVFHNGIWHVVYIAKIDIQKDQEFLVSYGNRYWNKRTKVDLFP